jgi:hypothetical protein
MSDARPAESIPSADSPGRGAASRSVVAALGTLDAGIAAALAAALAAGSALFYHLGRGTLFFYDEWNVVLDRREWTASSILAPHNEHLIAVPVLVYKTLLELVGLRHYGVYRLTGLVAHASVVVLLFLLLRRRAGPVAALAGALVVLFLGSGAIDFLWPFQVGYLLSLAGGLAALHLLERRGSVPDGLAALSLGVSLASASFGIPFAIGTAAELALRRSFRRLWLVVVPVALYGLWFLRYGRPGHYPYTNVLRAPAFAADLGANAFAGLAGLGLEWGRVLLVLAAIVTVWRLRNRASVTPRLVMLLTAVGLFWLLTGVTRANVLLPTDPKYVYPSAVFLLLIAAELVGSARSSSAATIALFCFVAFALAGNTLRLRDASHFLRGNDRVVGAELRALELADGRVEPGFVVDSQRAPQLTAGRYLAAVRQFGSPAPSAAEVVRLAPEARAGADTVLVHQLRLEPGASEGALTGLPPALESVSGGRAERSSSCIRVAVQAQVSDLDLRVQRGALLVRGLGPVDVRARRFADDFPTPALGSVAAGTPTRIVLLADRLGLPWHIRLTASRSFSACGVKARS